MLYISGAITAPTREEELSNMKLFYDLEEKLIAEGTDPNDIFNPAKLEADGKTWEEYLSDDLIWIYEHKPTIILLSNWQVSKGARLEVSFAKKLGLKIIESN